MPLKFVANKFSITRHHIFISTSDAFVYLSIRNHLFIDIGTFAVSHPHPSRVTIRPKYWTYIFLVFQTHSAITSNYELPLFWSWLLLSRWWMLADGLDVDCLEQTIITKAWEMQPNDMKLEASDDAQHFVKHFEWMTETIHQVADIISKDRNLHPFHHFGKLLNFIDDKFILFSLLFVDAKRFMRRSSGIQFCRLFTSDLIWNDCHCRRSATNTAIVLRNAYTDNGRMNAFISMRIYFVLGRLCTLHLTLIMSAAFIVNWPIHVCVLLLKIYVKSTRSATQKRRKWHIEGDSETETKTTMPIVHCALPQTTVNWPMPNYRAAADTKCVRGKWKRSLSTPEMEHHSDHRPICVLVFIFLLLLLFICHLNCARKIRCAVESAAKRHRMIYRLQSDGYTLTRPLLCALNIFWRYCYCFFSA